MQAKPEKIDYFSKEAFEKEENTVIRWLGNSGALINARGTTLLIDPVLSGFDMPLLIDMPIKEEEIPHADAVLITHCDNDHYGRVSCGKLKDKVDEFHSTHYVRELMKEELGIDGKGHDIKEKFKIHDVEVTLTPADHAWQNGSPKHHTREFKLEDYCGFWLDTPDGSIWAIGDSRLMEEQLQMPEPDVILFDFSDSKWHVGFEGALRIAACYPNATIIPWHWGSVDAPEWKEFNGDPAKLLAEVVNPERVKVLNPGEPFILKK